MSQEHSKLVPVSFPSVAQLAIAIAGGRVLQTEDGHRLFFDADSVDPFGSLRSHWPSYRNLLETVAHSDKVWLSLFMDTDDDTEIMYLGDPYGLYGTNLTIKRQFDSREDVLVHLTESLKVVHGGKADEFTKDWIEESIQRLSNDEEADFIEGNQTYFVSIESFD